MSKSSTRKIRIALPGKIITLEELYESKRKYHLAMAKLPFETKISILDKMKKEVKTFAEVRKANRKTRSEKT